MSKLIKEIMDVLNAAQKNKTEPYDRSGTVKRIEGKIAWVQLEGSDRETPIQMTIACDVGDTVQARIGGGSAWLTGNLTAPPTDDKKANQAISMVTTVVQEVQEQVEEALEDVSTVDDVTMQYCLSDSSSTFVQYGDWSNTPPTYVSGKYYWTRSVLVDDDGNETYGEPRYSQDTQLSVETDRAYQTTNAHFWYDNTGAYVTDATQDDYKSSASGKYATRVTPTGILQSYGGSTLSSWTNSGIAFYQGGSVVASFGSGGSNFYHTSYPATPMTEIGLNSFIVRNPATNYYCKIDQGAINFYGRTSAEHAYIDHTGGKLTFKGTQLRMNGKLTGDTQTPTIEIDTDEDDVGTLESTTVKQFGNVVSLLFKVKNSSAVSAGDNVFTGTLTTSDLQPATLARGVGFYGARPIMGSVSNLGEIVIRVFESQLPADTSVYCAFTYVTRGDQQ